MVKNQPVMHEMQEMWVRSLGQKDRLEKEMATHSNILAWKIPWTEEPAWLWSMRSQKGWTQLSARVILDTRNIIIIIVLTEIKTV